MLYAFVGFILPWIIMLGAAMAKVYNIWAYAIPITWFLMALFIFISFYKF